ncbi:MAG: InlB B-repeat-containing protein, partial [Nanoarchaeota archaeon]
EYTLNVNTQGQGNVEINPIQELYLYGDIINLNAIEEEGWAFTNWIGDVENYELKNTTIFMNNNKIIEAIFKPCNVYVDETYNEETEGFEITHFNNLEDALDAVCKNGTINIEDDEELNITNLIIEEITIGENEIRSKNMTVSLNATSNTTITGYSYSTNPHNYTTSNSTILVGEVFYELTLSDNDAVSWPIFINITYDENEVDETNLLGLMYWNHNTKEWELYSNTGVDKTNNYIWAYADHLTPLAFGFLGPNWVCVEYSNCTVNGYKHCLEVNDLNNLDEEYQGDYSEFRLTCDYCSIYGPTINAIDHIRVNEGEIVDINLEINSENNIQHSVSNPLNNQGRWHTKRGDRGHYDITIYATDGICDAEKEIKIVVNEESHHSLGISSINYNKLVRPGDFEIFSITVNNNGNRELNNIRASIFIDELGVWAKSGPVNLRANQETNIDLTLDIPYYAVPGEIIPARIVINNNEIRRVVYRDIEII